MKSRVLMNVFVFPMFILLFYIFGATASAEPRDVEIVLEGERVVSHNEYNEEGLITNFSIEDASIHVGEKGPWVAGLVECGKWRSTVIMRRDAWENPENWSWLINSKPGEVSGFLAPEVAENYVAVYIRTGRLTLTAGKYWVLSDGMRMGTGCCELIKEEQKSLNFEEIILKGSSGNDINVKCHNFYREPKDDETRLYCDFLVSHEISIYGNKVCGIMPNNEGRAIIIVEKSALECSELVNSPLVIIEDISKILTDSNSSKNFAAVSTNISELKLENELELKNFETDSGLCSISLL